MISFKDVYLNNELSIRDLHSYLELWHKEKPNISLQEYLGFNDDEYTAFAHSEAALKEKLDGVKSEVSQKVTVNNPTRRV